MFETRERAASQQLDNDLDKILAFSEKVCWRCSSVRRIVECVLVDRAVLGVDPADL